MWARHFRWSHDGTYESMLAAAETAGLAATGDGPVEQLLSVDSTVVQAHQHAAGARRITDVEVSSTAPPDTGGRVELQEIRGRAG